MIIKNFLIEEEAIDILEKELCTNNINYLLIKDEKYYELHFDEKMYRFFIFNSFIHDKKLDSLFLPEKIKVVEKEQTGYKKLRKNDYKNSKNTKTYSKKIYKSNNF